MGNLRRVWAKLFWIVLAITLLIYMIMIFWSLPRLSNLSGGLSAFDLRPGGYSFEEAKGLLTALGPDGSEFYLNVQQSLDTAYPALLVIVVVWALIRLDRGGWGWVFAVFSIAGGIFDYLENSAVEAMLLTGAQAVTPEMVEEASSWTLLKSICHSVAFTGLLILCLMAIYRWITTRRQVDEAGLKSEDEREETGT